MKKSELRKIYLARQKAFSQEERGANDKRISDSFFRNFDLSTVSYLHSFIPIDKFNEVDTKPIFQKIWRDLSHIVTVVPRVDFETSDITSLKFGPDTELVRNVWDIDEPLDIEIIETEKIDMVLVPGLCFDGDGHRVGYGKGFYDRFLKKCRPDAVTIGLSHFEPVEKIDGAHDGDVAVDFVVTPAGVTSQNRER